MAFTANEQSACRQLIRLAIAEDVGSGEDVTSQALVPAGMTGTAALVCREPGVVAGLPAAGLVCAEVEPTLEYTTLVEDGATVGAGRQLAVMRGSMRSLLLVERTALNFLQRLSGIATYTAKFTKAIAGLRARILDTRKTTPAFRLLEKCAVRCGGGHNHRAGLYDAVLIKDNHLAATAKMFGIAEAVKRAKDYTSGMLTIEVEVESLEQLLQVLPQTPDIVLLDNMPLEQLREAVRIRNLLAQGVQLEASGGVTLSNVRAVAETGVERISVGALTHSAPALDIALDFLPS